MADDNGYAQECVRGVTKRIKRALIRDARERGTNVTDAAVGVLAAHYGVDYEQPRLSRRRTDASADTEYATLMLRMPAELQRRIKLEHATSGFPARRDVVLTVLAEHYGLPYEPPPRPRRRRRA